MYRLATKRTEKNELEKRHTRLFRLGYTPCGLDDGRYLRKARGTLSRHSLLIRASGICSGAWQCCKQTFLHEVSVTSASA